MALLRLSSEFVTPSSDVAAAVAPQDLWWEKNKLWAMEKEFGSPLFHNDRYIIGDTTEESRKWCEQLGIDLKQCRLTVHWQRNPSKAQQYAQTKSWQKCVKSLAFFARVSKI